MPLLILAFFVVPFLELFVILKTADLFGGWNTIAILIVVSVVGGWLMKREGRKVWRRFNEQVSKGIVPSNDIADGALLLFAGALLLTPGFLTDIVGILILFPPTRAIFRAIVVKRFMKRTGLADLGGGVLGGSSARWRGGYMDTTLFEESTRSDPKPPQRPELDL